ncbi:MAG: ImmA/IrrE family metallo-endopeptidase [Bauldia sp.]|nr:ImmA/IrrE family metallo-endopeptidase [Bauldia sp.]
MTLAIAYPHDHRTREPRPMKAREIWGIADEVRQHLLPRRRTPCLDFDRVVRGTRNMVVNGVAISTHWDLDRTVHDGQGREALGVTEVDPALPGVVLISLNAAVIAERDYLKRSTLAHELGHALFDGPSMLRQAGQPAFAMVTPDEWHLTEPARGAAGIDWREFRANEFMGALLAPRALLNRELVRRAIAFGLPVRDVGAQEPILAASGNFDRVEALLLDLGERFGVSATFIEYRLRRYALVQ